MADLSKYILSRLFIAAPELQLDQALLKILFSQGLVSQSDLDIATKVRQKSKKYAGIASQMRGKGLIERLMLVVPEIMSVQTVDALRRWNLISITMGNALRVGLRGGKLLVAGNVAEATAYERWAILGNTVLSNDTINLLRDLDTLRIDRIRQLAGSDPEAAEVYRRMMEQSVTRAQIMRSVLSAGRLTADTAARAKELNTIWGVLAVVGEGILSDTLLRNAIRAGVISQERYELIRALEKLGLNVWKKGLATIDYDSFAARALLMSEGILSTEMITALLKAGLISRKLALLLYPSARAIRAITRGQLKNYRKGIRGRIVPGEPPIKSYARIALDTDRELLRLLAAAARDANKAALALSSEGKFGSLTRAAQQKILERELHLQMRTLWEGVGHLTIFGEKATARAALDSEDFLQRKLWGKTGKEGADFRRSIRRTAESGIDSYISRQENLLQLSRRIYKNDLLGRGRVSATINKGLLRGLSSKELANEVSGLIRPGVRGGVSYSAQRLSRTEINNAFHFSQIRHTREMPWVDGYKWNLSSSHPKLDICNTYAQHDDNLGRGVFKKGDVPGKPHPNCFCFITTVQASTGKFERQLRSGAYDRYLKSVESSGMFDESRNYYDVYGQQLKDVSAYVGSGLAVRAAKVLGKSAGQLALLGIL